MPLVSPYLLRILNNSPSIIPQPGRGLGVDWTLFVDRHCDRCAAVTPHQEAVTPSGEFVQRECFRCGAVTSAWAALAPTTEPNGAP